MRLLRDPRRRAQLTLALLGALVLALLAPFVVGAGARHLSAWRDGPEDASVVLEAIRGKAARVDAILATPSALRDVAEPRATLYVAIGPERAYDDAEADAVVSFLRRGGSVLLADEKGYGDAVANAAGFKFEAERVLDTRGHLNSPHLPVADALAAPGDASTYRVGERGDLAGGVEDDAVRRGVARRGERVRDRQVRAV
ncbi:MAG TPA: DUF4350 domain-containing protein, partial [Candidatus Thermoplasmatota archaeon]|nr:DUF4350 domain-containing protein [Candidatus Thermoplasmatota archaeon]